MRPGPAASRPCELVDLWYSETPERAAFAEALVPVARLFFGGGADLARIWTKVGPLTEERKRSSGLISYRSWLCRLRRRVVAVTFTLLCGLVDRLLSYSYGPDMPLTRRSLLDRSGRRSKAWGASSSSDESAAASRPGSTESKISLRGGGWLVLRANWFLTGRTDPRTTRASAGDVTRVLTTSWFP